MIYFIQGEITRRIKIGFTSKFINTRISTHQIGSPDKLFFIGYIPGLKETETVLHYKFRKYHSHGEWYNESDEIYNFIKNNCIHDMDIAHKADSLMNDKIISYEDILKLENNEIIDLYIKNLVRKIS